MKTHVITGGLGFVGVNLARRLLAAGDEVVAVDDLSRGVVGAMDELSGSAFEFVELDCADAPALEAAVASLGRPVEDVWHLAANSDIPAGVNDPAIDLHRTFLTTVGVLKMMKGFGVPRLHFASSSAIYGDHGDTLIHEDIGPLEPISNYGAMKLASEAQIRAAVEAFLPRANVFRFPNVVGVPATHGVILDLIRKLRASPRHLKVLGNGSQMKCYLHVDDLVDAMLHIAKLPGRYVVQNIGPLDEGVQVRFIAESVRDAISPAAHIEYGEEDRGWIGDVPRVRYSVQRLAATGWTPSLGSATAVRRAIAEIAEQEMGGQCRL